MDVYKLLFLALLCGVQGNRMKDEKRLMTKIFSDYDDTIIPIEDPAKPVVVDFDPELIRIIQISQREQFIEVYVWLRQSWFHPRMKWNSSEYGGIDSVKIASSKLWLPDIVMYNSVDIEERTSPDLNSYDTLVTVTPDGKNFWMKAIILRSTCILDVSHFPFDDQTCYLKFGSWTNDIRFIDLKGIRRQPNGSSYLKNGQWDLRDISVKRSAKKYACCEHKYVDVTITIKLRRNADSHFLNIVIPSALLSALVLLSFILPPESGERVSLCITVLLAVTVFQQLTAQMMPEYGMPYLGRYYFATLIITAISLAVTTMILNIYHRSTRRTPKWLRVLIIDWVGRVLFCDLHRTRFGRPSALSVVEESKNGVRLKPIQNGSTGNKEAKTEDVSSDESLHGDEYDVAIRLQNSPQHDAPYCQPSESADSAGRHMRQKEWLKMARVLDRFFFLTFLIIMVAAFLAVFMKAPRFAP